jgi:hypothetical protein
MGDCVVRIEKLENGFEVEICDPEVQAANKAPSKLGKPVPWKDPWKDYAFATSKEVIAFLTNHLDKLQPEDEAVTFAGSFAEAAKEDD